MDDVVKSENENKQPPVIEASKTISQVKLIDKPYVNLDNDDPLGISSYSLALSKFIEDCECPITIGLQGEWGSGKTSMFRAVEHKLTSGTALFEIEGKKQAYRVNKSDKYKVISINSWEHALLKSPQEALLSIIDEISGQIAAVDGTYEKNEKIKSLIGKVAKSPARVGASAVLGNSGGQAVDEIFNTGQQDNTIKQLRSALSVLVQSIVNRKTETSPEKFVVFIDDLDRLVPSDAVDVMELLKNIFDIDYCVFVLAIDYDVVVQGLMKKFGEPNDNNEWQFRAFFDKIIQLPFMMPIGAYKIHNYLEQLLGGKNSSAYFGGNEKVDAALESIVKYSVGPNPRGLKRLANSLRLIKLHYEEKNKANKESETSGTLSVTLKRVIFALVCIQISYPKIFEFLKRRPNFTEWDEKFVSEITGGEHIDDKELNKAFNRAVEFNEADFDDPWEQSLFKLVWKKTKNKNRAIDISRLLSIIEEKLVNADDFEQTITNAIDQTAVTSVVSTDGDINSENTKSEDSSEETLATQQFWERLKKKFGELSEEESAGFDAIRKGAKSGQVYRDCSYFDNGKIGIFIATSNFVKFVVYYPAFTRKYFIFFGGWCLIQNIIFVLI